MRAFKAGEATANDQDVAQVALSVFHAPIIHDLLTDLNPGHKFHRLIVRIDAL